MRVARGDIGYINLLINAHRQLSARWHLHTAHTAHTAGSLFMCLVSGGRRYVAAWVSVTCGRRLQPRRGTTCRTQLSLDEESPGGADKDLGEVNICNIR